MRRRSLLLVLFVVACSDKQDKGPLTPEEANAKARDGDAVTVEGDVHALTYDSMRVADDYAALADRFLLLRSVVPPGVSIHDETRASFDVAWGLAVRLPAATLTTSRLPQIGDHVRVKGTYRKASWNGSLLPIVEEATVEVLSGAAPLALAGASCAGDLDCQDRLLCDRATRQCVAPPEILWSDAKRNVNGVCSDDADCPLGQRCDRRYVVPAEGPYAPHYYLQRDAGKSVCVPEDGATLETLCPRRARMADVVGGRYAAGKEVCVEADVWLAVIADDRDTHLQLTVHEPVPFPEGDVPYWVFGGASEIAPLYKDPSRPQGALLDPRPDEHIVVVGTVHWDDSHGWWEVHPLKAVFHLPAAKPVRPYPSRPQTFDLEELERKHR